MPIVPMRFQDQRSGRRALGRRGGALRAQIPVGRALACVAVALLFAVSSGHAAPRANGSIDAPSSGKEARRSETGNLVGHGGSVRSVVVSADGTRALTGSFDYSMMAWDLTSTPPKMLARFAGHDAGVNVVRFLPGETMALTAGDDGIVRVWEIATGKLVDKFTGHAAKVVDVAISPDGRWAASAGWDLTVRLWNLRTGEAGPVLRDHTGPVNAVVFAAAPDGSGLALYSGSQDGDVRLFDAATGAFKRVVYSHGWGINCLKALPDPKLLLYGAVNGAAGVIDVTTGEVRKVLVPHEDPVLALAVAPDKDLAATGGGDGTIRVWQMSDWSLKEEYNNPFGPIWSLAFAADGEHIYYSGLDDFVTRWQVRPREPFEELASQVPRRLQASQDMPLGQRQFARKCSVCHTLAPDGGNRAGPTLYGVFGRKAGSLPGYPYSDALRNSTIVWSEKTIGELFEYGPEHVTPGTKMPLQKMTDPQAREALIAFLKSATATPGAPQQPATPSKEQ